MGSATQVTNSGVSFGNSNTNNGNSTITTTTITNNNAPITNNTILPPQPDKAKSEILQWISPLEFPDRHRKVQELRFNDVGQWILQTDNFRDWENGPADPTFLCYGDPGAGKTFISSLVIDALRSQAGENFCVLYLYCDYDTCRKQSATDLIAELLKKAVFGLDGTPEEVSREFEKSKKCGDRERPPLQNVVNMLGGVLASFERAFICIDALDEFPPGQRSRFLDSLLVLIHLSPKTRLFLTGRPRIRYEVEQSLGEGVQMIPIKASEEDIQSYITERLSKDRYPKEMNPGLEADIKQILPQKALGIFLLVYLTMEAVLRELTIQKRRERLYAMGDIKELQDMYRRTLDRITEQDTAESELALKVLMWLYYSKRPLHADELGHALGVEKGSTKLNSENVSSTQTLLGCCLGLVTVDKKASTVRFIHSTLKDYLRFKTELFPGTDLTIAETCLTYLNSEDIRSLPPSLRIAPKKNPFLQYASCYWGEHAREKPTDDVKALAKEFLGLCHKHISAKLLLLEKSWPWRCDPKSPPFGFSGLHCAAFFGLQEMAAAFLNAKVSNLGQKDITGSIPLMWAARNGHEGLVRLLLDRKDIFNPETEDADGCTPFLWAARNGHRSVVALFLAGNTINLEMKDHFGRTPLLWASGGGHQGVVKLLLEQGANPETKDCHDRTPLSWASGGGHRDVVKLLLGIGKVCPNFPDAEDRAPVSWAAEGGHEEVVDFFLHHHGVCPNKLDQNGRTLLSRAAESGSCSVVNLLLGQTGIEAFMADNAGTTPFSWAASKGNEAVVELFMEKREIGAGPLDEHGSASLWWAAGSGHVGVVRLLLETEGIDPNLPGGHMETPLVRAAMHGHEQVVKLLLSKNVNCNLADCSGRTPLSWAAGGWRDKVVGLLLGIKSIDTEAADGDDRTPLLWAARNGDERVVRLLLEKGNAEPDPRDTGGRTPLSWAASGGHEKVVDLLLDWPDVNPNSVDEVGRTPLSWAAGNGQEAVAKLLLLRGDIKLDMADSAGRIPLSWATRNGREAVTKLLLDRSNLEPDAADSIGRTLPWAQQHKPVSTTLFPLDPILELRLWKLHFDAQKPIDGSSLPTHIFGCLLSRLSACSLSHIFRFFLYLIVLWALCLYVSS